MDVVAQTIVKSSVSRLLAFSDLHLSLLHNKKNRRGYCKPSEIKAFKTFLNQDLHLLYI